MKIQFISKYGTAWRIRIRYFRFIATTAGFLCFINAHAQSQFSISLNVNGSTYDTIYLDEPVILTVALSNQFAEYEKRNNREAQLYLDEMKAKLGKGEIRQDYYDAEVKRVTATMKEPQEISIGTKSQPWAGIVSFEIAKPQGAEGMQLSPFEYPQTDAVAVLNESAYYRAAYGFDNKLSAGDYTLTARLKERNSENVQLTVMPLKIPDEVMNTEAMLLHFADYYGLQGNNTKALEYAGKIISLFPNSIDGFLMRADIRARLEKWNDALADYQTALRLFSEQYPDSYEAPEYTLQMIEFVKGKGGK